MNSNHQSSKRLVIYDQDFRIIWTGSITGSPTSNFITFWTHQVKKKKRRKHIAHIATGATGGVIYKKVLLKISLNSQENICPRASFLIKLQGDMQVFSREFCEIFKDTFLQNTFERLLLHITPWRLYLLL